MATLRKIKSDIAREFSLGSTTELETLFDSGWNRGGGNRTTGPKRYRYLLFAHPQSNRYQIAVSMDRNDGSADVSTVNRYD